MRLTAPRLLARLVKVRDTQELDDGQDVGARVPGGGKHGSCEEAMHKRRRASKEGGGHGCAMYMSAKKNAPVR